MQVLIFHLDVFVYCILFIFNTITCLIIGVAQMSHGPVCTVRSLQNVSSGGCALGLVFTWAQVRMCRDEGSGAIALHFRVTGQRRENSLARGIDVFGEARGGQRRVSQHGGGARWNSVPPAAATTRQTGASAPAAHHPAAAINAAAAAATTAAATTTTAIRGVPAGATLDPAVVAAAMAAAAEASKTTTATAEATSTVPTTTAHPTTADSREALARALREALAQPTAPSPTAPTADSQESQDRASSFDLFAEEEEPMEPESLSRFWQSRSSTRFNRSSFF